MSAKKPASAATASAGEKYTVSAAALAELKLADANLRAARAESALAARQLADAEAAMGRCQVALSDEITEGSKYEVASSLDAGTGVVMRREKTPG